jgi:hypothetical protein
LYCSCRYCYSRRCDILVVSVILVVEVLYRRSGMLLVALLYRLLMNNYLALCIRERCVPSSLLLRLICRSDSLNEHPLAKVSGFSDHDELSLTCEEYSRTGRPLRLGKMQDYWKRKYPSMRSVSRGHRASFQTMLSRVSDDPYQSRHPNRKQAGGLEDMNIPIKLNICLHRWS